MVPGMLDRTCNAPLAPNSLRSCKTVYMRYVKDTHLERLDSRYHSHVHYANGSANGHSAGGDSRDDHWNENLLVEEDNGLAL
jgi:hypothetical protein